ncbi:MAG: nucleotidyl transferase AbiEii/AbiGii toxin family protein [Bacteroidales bacterium]|nr:nucleotidyl transferase AbiEii/AbiGii toxin family protein [Bacteroidales bacterium]MBN2757818.1 nucleotidyl transferase AbiEii/AbiGii toxin family protein [Bacteroidales bacterium]
MLSKYDISSENEILNALKEIFQEITLLGLYRGNFFSEVAFYGGTSLRILYGLNRFSEDLDFSLIEKNQSFNIEDYFKYIINEFDALGVSIELRKKIKKEKSSDIESAFLKNDTSIHTLDINTKDLENILEGIDYQKKIKIKIEVDTNPPLKFQTEAKTLLMPMTFNIVSMTLPNLYAGKMHAVLCREWKTRVKGRDWYDFEWYVKNNTKLNLEHLKERMIESGDFERSMLFDKKIFIELMNNKIDTLNLAKAIEEVKPFIKDNKIFDFWSKDYFRLLTTKILFA